jgi:hypothetical protein
VTKIISVKDVNTMSVVCSNIKAKSESFSLYDDLMVFTSFCKKSPLYNYPFEEFLSDVATRKNSLNQKLIISPGSRCLQ